MKHLINSRDNLIEEMIEGLVDAYDGRISKVPGVNGIVSNSMRDDRVALLVGGGSGHEPIYHGLVGYNMADAAAIGNIFASPNPEIIFETAMAVQRGRGVLFLYGNYAGDNMNFDIAAEMLEEEGVPVKTVRIKDDVATEDEDQRRGISGLYFIVKIAGAACSEAESLEEAFRITEKATANVRSMGVALQAGTMLNTGKPTFELGQTEMEIGMGIHGEPGVLRTELKSADETAGIMMERIISDLSLSSGDETAMFVNDLGSMTNMELLIAARKASAVLRDKGIVKRYTDIGKYATTMDMRGYSISLLKLDAELERYFFMPSSCLAFDYCPDED